MKLGTYISPEQLDKIKDKAFAMGFVVGSVMTTIVCFWAMRVFV